MSALYRDRAFGSVGTPSTVIDALSVSTVTLENPNDSSKLGILSSNTVYINAPGASGAMQEGSSDFTLPSGSIVERIITKGKDEDGTFAWAGATALGYEVNSVEVSDPATGILTNVTTSNETFGELCQKAGTGVEVGLFRPTTSDHTLDLANTGGTLTGNMHAKVYYRSLA